MTTTTGIGVHDQNLERQIEKHMGGCMSGFFNLFDRSHLLAGKRLYPKRLPPPLPSSSSDVADSSSEPPSAVGSPASSREFKKCQVQRSQSSPKSELRSPANGDPPKSPLAVSPWKFTREAPRLSLDSRAVVDAKGSLRINTSGGGDEERENQQRSRSPSVIARLMGLEPVLTSSSSSVSEPPEKKVELRRSASESRSRDYRFFDAPSFLSPIAGAAKTEMSGERKSDQSTSMRNPNYCGNVVNSNPNVKNNNQRRLMVERKSFYDTADFFPPVEIPAKCQQQQQYQAVTIYGEIERRLRMRGIDEPSKDLETLKHILEALQLKGLLHSSTAAAKPRQNVVPDRRFSHLEGESPVVLMRPGGRTSPAVNRRSVSLSGEPSVSPRRERPTRSRAENNRSSSPTTVRRKGGPLSIETQRRGGETTTTPRSSHSPAQSPKKNSRRSSDNQTVNRSPRSSRRSTAEITQEDRRSLSGPTSPEDEASTISESSYSTSSHTDNERWRVEEYREGKNLLERCDKLLHSIAEMNSNPNSAEMQKPSPVSVLDSSFYKDDESSPSPVKKRTIDFKDPVLMELEDEQWSPPSSRSQLLPIHHPDHHHLRLRLDHDHHLDIDSSDGSDFGYVSEVLRASMYHLPHETDLFLLLEKQNSIRNRNKDNNNSKASILRRKLTFDTITEILARSRELPPWKAASSLVRPTMGHIWAEFLRIQERGPSEDLLEVICGVLKKDLAGDSINGWGDRHVEMSEAVLDIERLIFKDLIGETIRDMAAFAGKSVGDQALRRKLVF